LYCDRSRKSVIYPALLSCELIRQFQLMVYTQTIAIAQIADGWQVSTLGCPMPTQVMQFDFLSAGRGERQSEGGGWGSKFKALCRNSARQCAIYKGLNRGPDCRAFKRAFRDKVSSTSHWEEGKLPTSCLYLKK
jgi:hypothetical protein